MSLAIRINKLVDEAFAKGQTHISTTLQLPEIFQQDEVDRVITDLRAQGFTVTHDDVYNDMSIRIPLLSMSERARRIAYASDAVIREQIESITKDILQASRLGYVDTEEDFYDLADPSIVENIHEHFAREGFNVSRTDDTKYNHIQLRIRWGK